MLNISSPQICIGITPSSIAIARVTGILRKSNQIVAEKMLPLDQRGVLKHLCDQLSALIKDNGLRNSSAKLVLSDALARFWMVQPPLNASTMSDLQAATAARFQTLYGESPSQWTIQADYQHDRPYLAAAIPSAWLEAIEAVKRDFHMKINEIAPQSVVAYNRWHHLLQAGSWLVNHQEGKIAIAITGEKKHIIGYRHIQCRSQDIADESSFTYFLRQQALLMSIPLSNIICFPNLTHELSWLKFARVGQPNYRVLQKKLFDNLNTVSSGVDLALTGA